MRRTTLCLLLIAAPLTAQQNRSVPGTLVMAVGQEPTKPYPIIGSALQADADVSDQLFLRLAGLGASLRTTGDDALRPELAKGWRRTDSLTVLFDLDPRAHWHDGKAVVANDVVFAWKLMSNPVVAFNGLTTLEPIAAVEAVSPQTVRVRFRRAFPEQVYLAGFNLLPMPAHLLESVAAESIATSSWARQPIGNGPYRFSRRVAGEFVELQANPSFFLGKPGISRLVFRYVADGTARKNLLISGETDVLEGVPTTQIDEIKAQPRLRLVTVASNLLSYALFNSRNPADTSQPNPILGDIRVREALTLALDRKTMAASVFAPGVGIPDAAQSQLWGWITPGGVRGVPQNVARAKALLAAAGWRDSDGDGVLDRSGKALRLAVLLPNSPTRRPFGIQAQQMWRAVGVQADLEIVERAEYGPKREAGHWDIDFAGAGQDPAPSSLVQSWSCATSTLPGTSNVGHWCDSTFDRLVRTASQSRTPVPAWGAAIARMSAWHPAIFLAAPVSLVAAHQRFTNVTIWPSRPWRSLWLWRVNPAMALPRDR